MRCSNNLKQLGVAIHNYASANSDKLPPAMYRAGNGTVGEFPFSGQNILTFLLPYIEQDALYKAGTTAGNGGPPFYQANTSNGVMRIQPIKTFQCPSDPTMTNGFGVNQVGSWAGSSYGGNFLVFGQSRVTTWGTSWEAQYTIANIPDGTSNTVGFTEKYAACGSSGSLWSIAGGDWGNVNWTPLFALQPWSGNWALTPLYQPNPWNTQCDNYRPSTAHTGSCQALMLDGSVRGVAASVSQTTWAIVIQPSDGLAIPSNW